LTDAGGAPNAAGNLMLASLTARLSGGGGLASGGSGGASVVTPVPAATPLSASLNPSGLRLGSTLPTLPAAAPSSLGPAHAPFVRQMADR